MFQEAIAELESAVSQSGSSPMYVASLAQAPRRELWPRGLDPIARLSNLGRLSVRPGF